MIFLLIMLAIIVASSFVINDKELFLNISGTIMFTILVVGYIANIVYIAYSGSITGMLVLRIIGIFIPPIGALLGYI
jgi:hypothetical protein